MNERPSPLFIFEMANNHMGSVDHGLQIIRELHQATSASGARQAIKFQYRQLDTFIHPDFRAREDVKYVKRFNETRLSIEQFLTLKNEAEKLGFITICTGFDEASIDLIEQQRYSYIKIASCSLTDWHLLERIAAASLPIIASVGGSSLDDVDRVVSFFEHRKRDLSLMHCVAEYPTPDALLQLGQIDLLKARYPTLSIGFSTHERPELLDAVKLAVAKGATILERHVGVRTERYALNAYSSTPAQAAAWVEAALSARVMCGVSDKRAPFTATEIKELHALRRGVFARGAVKAGETITMDKLFLAIPTSPGQYTANDLSKYAVLCATEDIPAGASINRTDTKLSDNRERVTAAVRKVRDFIVASRVPFPAKADVEVSHHYGMEKFGETGAVLLSFVNRSYCKKAIVMLAGQSHPEHWHKVKEETFFVLHGAMKLSLDGTVTDVKAGDSILVEPGVKHWFSTETGVIFEEISSTHVAQDSFYSDPAVGANKNRKTYVTYWMA